MNRIGLLMMLLLLCCLLAPAQRMEFLELREVVARMVRLHVPDAQTAARVRRLQPTQQVPEGFADEARSWGAGEMTVRELLTLAEKSARKPANLHPLPSVQGRPGAFPIRDGEPAVILESIRLYAEEYAQSIPNFLCYRNTTFLRDKTGTGRWRPNLTLKERLIHLEEGDHQQIVAVDGEAVEGNVEVAHGGVSVSGEFGNIVRRLFQERSQTEFFWIEDFQEAGERRVAIGFRVAVANSSLTMSSGDKELKSGYQGELTASAESGRIYRLRLSLDELEPGFPFRGSSWDIHYAEVQVDDLDLLLPARAITEAYERSGFRRNEATYTDYQEYTADSVIQFGDVAGAQEWEQRQGDATPF
jgi:hypothetical protein